MIRNERQYRITRAQAQRFREALQTLHNRDTDGTHPIMRAAEEAALKSQLADLEKEIEDFESLASGDQVVLDLESFAELPESLIRARIATGLTQRQLAERLGIKEQQVQRNEATNYASVSVKHIGEVIEALGIDVREQVIVPARGSTDR